MIARHRLTVTATCPVDQQGDVYRVLVETTRMLTVEEIISAAHEAAAEPIFQEGFTVMLARRLRARVVTTGEHSCVSTECEAGLP